MTTFNDNNELEDLLNLLGDNWVNEYKNWVKIG